jgi:HEAT repeats/PBS lyase HEAT-like repeat
MSLRCSIALCLCSILPAALSGCLAPGIAVDSLYSPPYAAAAIDDVATALGRADYGGFLLDLRSIGTSPVYIPEPAYGSSLIGHVNDPMDVRIMSDLDNAIGTQNRNQPITLAELSDRIRFQGDREIEAVTRLLEANRSGNDPEEEARAIELGKQKAAASLKARLDNPRFYLLFAAYFCPQEADAATLAPILAQSLGDKIAETRVLALLGLGKLGPSAAANLEEVRGRTSDGNPVVRCYAALALWKIEGRPESVVSVLTEELGDMHEDVRNLAALLLGRMGPDAAAAVPALCRSLQQQSSVIRAQVLFAIGKVGSAAAPLVPQVCKVLRECDDLVYTEFSQPGMVIISNEDATNPEPRSIRSYAAMALAQIGRGNPEALTALKEFRRSTWLWTADRLAADEALRLMARE